MTGFKVVALGYLLSGSTWLLSQVPDVSAFAGWIQYGALGLLGVTVVGQLYIIVVAQRDAFNRMDGWEKQRHEDSHAMNETLTRLRENCSAMGRKKSD
jgi:hypothetical protein